MPDRPPPITEAWWPARRRERRGNAARRGYDRTWQRLRERHLRRHPACEDCGLLPADPAELAVHHLEPVATAPGKRLDPKNLRTLCRQCHGRRHRGG
ncbi:MAG: HNH endonuclease signature motif containing protein [Planctomycetota bacterium]